MLAIKIIATVFNSIIFASALLGALDRPKRQGMGVYLYILLTISLSILVIWQK